MTNLTTIMFTRLMVLSCFLFVSGCASITATNPLSPVTVKSSFWGAKYLIDGNAVNRGTLKNHISSSPEALSAFQKSNLTNNGSAVLGGLGGAAIGSALGSAQASGESADSTVIGLGVVLVGLGFAVAKSGEKHMNKGVEIFNSSLVSFNHQPSRFLKVLSSVYITDSELGFSYRF